ncbi:MAG: murein biosynthesis integral membrane protein MurJ [Herpetosiphon sp.]|nr:murein biosynthesis integral membrane protein MurJ [Herpetosiphon sp.]
MSNDQSSLSPTQPAKRSLSVALNSAIVMLGFVLSRVIGLIRDMFLNAYFDVSSATDAYQAAFRIPDLLYLVIIGGALGSAFIPVFIEAYTKDNTERAWRILNIVTNIALIALAVASLILMLVMPWLNAWLYPKVSPEQHALITYLSRIFLLSPLLLGLGGLAMASLNALDRFTFPALAPVMYNVAIIIGVVLFAPLMTRFNLARYPTGIVARPNGELVSIEGVAWGVVIGALLYLAFQVPSLRHAGFRYHWIIDWRDAAVRKIGSMMAPRVFGQAVMQINIIAITSYAGRYADGTIAGLNSAYQLMLLPHGILVLSLATVMFPQLSRLFAKDQLSEFNNTVRSTLGTVLWTVIPASLGLAILGYPIISLLFVRGNFTAESAAFVWGFLIFYATALPAFAGSEIMIRAYYARQNTKIPVIVGIATVIINIVLGALVVSSKTNPWALAAAFSIANNLELLLLLIIWRKQYGNLDPHNRLRRTIRISLIATFAMVVAINLVASFFGKGQFLGIDWLAPRTTAKGFVLIGQLLFEIGCGVAVYAFVSYLQKSDELLVWQDRIMRRFKRS